jgi:hypothetical protein
MVNPNYTNHACWYCGATGHDDNPCPQRVADADRAVAGFPDREVPAQPTKPAKLTGTEAAAARAMEFRLSVFGTADGEVIMQRAREAMAARQAMGREKYPTELADNHAPLKERVMHAWEEALDGAAYSQWMWEWWMSAESSDGTFDRSIPAGRTAIECLRLFSQAIVELDRLMRALGMDPVRKEGQP